jgi:cytochrome c
MKARQLIILMAVLSIVLSACGGSDDGGATSTTVAHAVGPGDPIAGVDVYKSSCSNCHGGDLQGVPGLGNPMAPNTFVVVNSEDELAAFIAVGRPADDPDNSMGISMPGRGGNPALDEQDLVDVAAYLKSQN